MGVKVGSRGLFELNVDVSQCLCRGNEKKCRREIDKDVLRIKSHTLSLWFIIPNNIATKENTNTVCVAGGGIFDQICKGSQYKV